jgi:hypothetical protein
MNEERRSNDQIESITFGKRGFADKQAASK